MRQVALVLLALAASGCCCDRPLKKEAYASVPLTLAEAKGLADAGAEVTVTRVSRRGHPSGGIVCGHSPLCVLVVPFVLIEALYPVQWDSVVVTRDGKVVLVAEYTTDGVLIHAQHLVGDEMRETRVVELKSLGKKAWVDTARLEPLPDGGVNRVPLPLSDQHDFVSEIRAMLGTTKDPKKRAAAIREARYQLEEEGLAFAVERLEDPGEDDKAKALVIEHFCEEALLPAAGTAPGPWTELQLARCHKAGPERDAFFRKVAQRTCAEGTSEALLDAFEEELTRTHPELIPELEKCPPGPRRALLSLWLEQVPDETELEALLSSKLARFAQKRLLVTERTHRVQMVRLIREGKDVQPILANLTGHQTVLEPELLASLAEFYVSPKGFFTTTPRGEILRLFDNAAAARAPTQPARDVLLAALAKARKNDERALLQAGLVALGDSARINEAARYVKRPLPSGRPSLEEQLPAYALLLVGCDSVQLQALADKKTTTVKCGARPPRQP